jgi:hypothetical protein
MMTTQKLNDGFILENQKQSTFKRGSEMKEKRNSSVSSLEMPAECFHENDSSDSSQNFGYHPEVQNANEDSK